MSLCVDIAVTIYTSETKICCLTRRMDIPAIPPIGTEMEFGTGPSKEKAEVSGVMYSEERGTYDINLVINLDVRRYNAGAFISEEHYPRQLMASGFTLSYLDEKYEYIRRLNKPTAMQQAETE